MASVATRDTTRPEKGFALRRDAGQRGREHETQSRTADRRAAAQIVLATALDEAQAFFERPGFELVMEGDSHLIITWPKSAGLVGTVLKKNLLRLMGVAVSSEGNTHSARFRNSARRDVGVVTMHRIIAAAMNRADPALVDISDINSVRGPT